jgi:hypothetical protein
MRLCCSPDEPRCRKWNNPKQGNPEALQCKARNIVECERLFRGSGIDAATELIRLLGVPS